MDNRVARYMTREKLPERRITWRQKVRIMDAVQGTHKFYVDFGEYPDGRLAEVFITSHKTGTFVRGTLDVLARTISIALQSGTSPLDMAECLCGHDYPPKGCIDAPGSTVRACTSIADYIGREIKACYGADGKRLPVVVIPQEGSAPTEKSFALTVESAEGR